MIVIKHSNKKREAKRMPRDKARATARALNTREETKTWGWTYRTVRVGLFRHAAAAYTKQGKLFGYFVEAMAVR